MFMARSIKILRSDEFAPMHARITEVGVKQAPLVQGLDRDRPEQVRRACRQIMVVTSPARQSAVQLVVDTQKQHVNLHSRETQRGGLGNDIRDHRWPHHQQCGWVLRLQWLSSCRCRG